MHLVMFDIDGTLTRTNRVDTACFLETLSDVLGIWDVDCDWAGYTNVSAQGCLEEIVLKHTGRPVTDDESQRVCRHHVGLLDGRSREDASHFEPVAGAVRMLGELRDRPNVVVAMATGAWIESARLKLRCGGFPEADIPIATSSDAPGRQEIVKLAEDRAKQSAGVAVFETRTYVGDGVWDVQTSHQLRYDFIGIAGGENAATLRSQGATAIVPDFTDSDFDASLAAIWNSGQTS